MWPVGSVVAFPGLQSPDLIVVVHEFVELVALGHVESSVSEVKPVSPALAGRLSPLSYQGRPKLPLLKEHRVVHRWIRVPLFRCRNMGDTHTHSAEPDIWVTPSQRG